MRRYSVAGTSLSQDERADVIERSRDAGASGRRFVAAIGKRLEEGRLAPIVAAGFLHWNA
jgi:hypothetical protein